MSHALTSRQRHIKAATAVDLGVFYSTVSAGMLLVRRYLTGRGVDQEFADRYGSAFGRTAAKIYRTSNGAEPRRAWSNVSGKWRRVNGYLPTETEILDEAYTTYKRTAEYVVTEPASELSPVEVYIKETDSYAARFENITGDMLRDLERQYSTEASTDFVTERLADLAAWKQSIDRYATVMVGDVDQAERAAVQGLPWDDPKVLAWLQAERGGEDYASARDDLNAAYVDWSFDLSGTVDVPDVPRPPAPVIAEGCRIPGCDRSWHYDGVCVVQLGEVKFDGTDCALPAELADPVDGPRSIVAFGYDMEALNLRREMRDRVSARNFAGELRALADSIDDASAHLPVAP